MDPQRLAVWPGPWPGPPMWSRAGLRQIQGEQGGAEGHPNTSEARPGHCCLSVCPSVSQLLTGEAMEPGRHCCSPQANAGDSTPTPGTRTHTHTPSPHQRLAMHRSTRAPRAPVSSCSSRFPLQDVLSESRGRGATRLARDPMPGPSGLAQQSKQQPLQRPRGSTLGES